MNLSRFLLTLSYTLLLLQWAYAATKNQDFVDNADPGQEEEKPTDGSSNHPYVGIPVSTWKITDKNITEKEEVCTQQLAFCTNECGGSHLVTKNFCNTVTMAWDCKCQNHVPDTPPYAWPITVAECQGKENACSQGCTYGTTRDLCLKGCGRYYRCNQAGSPASGLKVENENDMPKYNVAASDSSASSSLIKIISLSRSIVMLVIIKICF